RLASAHVVKTGRVSFVIGDEFNGGAGAQDADDLLSQRFNRDFFFGTNIEDLAARGRTILQANEGLNDIADVTEATGLLAVAENAQGPARFGGGDEARQDHAVAAGLPRSDGIEEAGNDNREVAPTGVGESEEFVHEFRAGIAPAGM